MEQPKKVTIAVAGATLSVYLEDGDQWGCCDVYIELMRPALLALGYDDSSLKALMGVIH